MTPASHGVRQAGLLLPLFSCHSSSSWGIGEFADVPAVAAWMHRAGLRVWQLLPLNEMAPGQTSPYSALSSMALDPIFIRVPDVEDVAAVGGAELLDTALRGMLAHVRSTRGVDYWAVRTLKDRVLRQAWRRFTDDELGRDSPRGLAFRAFADREAWWLDDYAVFRAALHVTDGMSWQDWPGGLGRRVDGSVERARREHHREVQYRTYLQWIAQEQWQAARRAALDVRVFGDFPFMVAADSADAWGHQDLFSFAGTVGAPPDAFSKDGQNWKLPAYRWDALRTRGYDWFARRARRMADLFDGFRVDHVVGLFRTWIFPVDGSAPHFTPADEPAQAAQGRDVIEAIRRAGAFVVAEDLGTIPDFVRAALQDVNVPGYKVVRWERYWHDAGQPLIDPVGFPPTSLVTSGTHDTETAAQWWAEAPRAEREALLVLPSLCRVVQAGGLTPDTPFNPLVRDAVLELLMAAGSNLAILPVQDVFGWPDRVNVPGLVDDHNWTWKLPWGVDRLVQEPEALDRARALARWGREYGR